MQIDLKGLPTFIMSKVLRAHPVSAIKALRKHFNKTHSHRSWPFSSFSFSHFTSNSLSISRNYNDPLPVEHFVNEEKPKT